MLDPKPRQGPEVYLPTPGPDSFDTMYCYHIHKNARQHGNQIAPLLMMYMISLEGAPRLASPSCGVRQTPQLHIPLAVLSSVLKHPQGGYQLTHDQELVRRVLT